jgi:NAD(P)-dependent dehydrogenase (short-subunit alcohol dehydrogenase family)
MPVAIVTGASLGLGLAVARELSRRGWRLVLDARHREPLDDAVRSLADPDDAVAIAGDVTDARHRADLVAAGADLGGVDLLVNNASTLGVSPLQGLATLPVEALTDVLSTNVVAPLALAQALLPQIAQRGGRVVNISSDAAVEAYPGWGGYGASKAALDQATAVLAAEQPDLRIYAFDPGDMRTQMHQDAYPGEDISDRPAPETVVPALMRLVLGNLPSGRYRAADLHESARAAAAGASS